MTNVMKRARERMQGGFPAVDQGELVGIGQLVMPPFTEMMHKARLQHDGEQPHTVELNRRRMRGSKKSATGLQACRSNMFLKRFASPAKTLA